ncbi:GNAT family N-acetyltransferase [Paenibacillus sp. NPDC056933]|uniref:GNAT family N-acetyltransferase n=1 Tax=Paenibacillus sp. NPDC056933 TaxID=3345968 RepID=UPI00363F00E1
MRIESVNKYFKDIRKLKTLYVNSFPENERIPMWFLSWKAKKNFIDFFAIYDIEIFVGFTYIITHKDISFILFFATSPELRSKGYGSKILTLIQERYAGNRIILNIEALEPKVDNYEQRQKRKKFYLNNQFRNTTFNIVEHGDLYEVLVYGNDVSAKEYLALIRSFTGTILSYFYSPKLTQG